MGFNFGFKGLNTNAKDDFYKGIQKLYDSANLCVQLEGMYVGNQTIKLPFPSSKYFFIMPVLKLSRRTVYVRKTGKLHTLLYNLFLSIYPRHVSNK